MMFSWNIGISTYHDRGEHDLFPDFYRCPHCRCHRRLRRHGFYWRDAVCLSGCYVIPVQRYLCPVCHRTTSALPSFLLPYFQYSLSIVMFCLLYTLVKKHTLELPRFRGQVTVRQRIAHSFASKLAIASRTPPGCSTSESNDDDGGCRMPRCSRRCSRRWPTSVLDGSTRCVD